MESPSKNADFASLTLPLTHWLAAVSHPSVLDDGSGSFAHWSRDADALASVNVVRAVPEMEPVAVTV